MFEYLKIKLKHQDDFFKSLVVTTIQQEEFETFKTWFVDIFKPTMKEKRKGNTCYLLINDFPEYKDLIYKHENKIIKFIRRELGFKFSVNVDLNYNIRIKWNDNYLFYLENILEML